MDHTPGQTTPADQPEQEQGAYDRVVWRLQKRNARDAALRRQYERMAQHQSLIDIENNAQCNLR